MKRTPAPEIRIPGRTGHRSTFFSHSITILVALLAMVSPLRADLTIVSWLIDPPQGLTATGGNPNNNGQAFTAITTVGAGAPTATQVGDSHGDFAIAANWDNGSGSKAWQLAFNATGSYGLKFSMQMQATALFISFNGPKDFKLQYSLNGSSWTDVPGGTFTAPKDAWGSVFSGFTLPAACDNQPLVYLRWIMTSNNGYTAAVTASGQSQLDNIFVNSATNAPTDLALDNSVVSENLPAATLVGNLEATDPDSISGFVYALVAGAGATDNASFTISGNQLQTSGALAAGLRSIRVRVTDDTAVSFEKVLNVLVEVPNPWLVGSQFRVSDMGPDGSTAYASQNAVAAYSATSDLYLVVWTGEDNAGGLLDGETEVWGRFYNGSTGTPTGARFQISFMGGANGNIAYDVTDVPSVTWNSQANEFMVVWAADDNTGGLIDNETEIFGQRVGTTGALVGTRFRISTMGPDGNVSFAAASPSIAYNAPSNNFLVVWSADDNTSPLVDNESEIYGRLVSNTGTLLGSQLRISNMGTDGNASFDATTPKVVFNATDLQFLVVWQGDDNTSPVIDNEIEIWGRLVNADASTPSPRFRISDAGDLGNTAYSVNAASAAWNSTANEYLVVWTATDNTFGLVAGENEIFGQRLSPAGAELGSNDFRISDMGGTGDAVYDASAGAAVIYNWRNDEYFVAWRADDNTFPYVDNETEVWGQRLDGATCAELDLNDFRLSRMGRDGTNRFAAVGGPAIALNTSSSPLQPQMLVVWYGDTGTAPTIDNENEIYARLVQGPVAISDSTPPSVTSVTVPANGTYRAPQALDFTVNLDEAVVVNTVGGTPRLAVTLNTGGTVSAAYQSGSGTTALTFRYTVASGNLDPDGIGLSGAIDLNGGTIKDAASNNANLALNSVASTAGVLVDGVAPTVLSVVRKNPIQHATALNTMVFEVTFSEDVTNVDSSSFGITNVNGGTVTGTVTAVGGGPRVYQVTVQLTGGTGEFRLDVVDSGAG
jgi:hypothetical protein